MANTVMVKVVASSLVRGNWIVSDDLSTAWLVLNPDVVAGSTPGNVYGADVNGNVASWPDSALVLASPDAVIHLFDS